jgi:hypothetical protein
MLHEVADAGRRIDVGTGGYPFSAFGIFLLFSFLPCGGRALSWLPIGRGADLVEWARRQVTNSPRPITIGVATQMGKRISDP